MIKKTVLMSTTAALLLLAPTAAHAAGPMTMEQMQAQLETLSKQVEKLSSVVQTQDKLIRAQQAQLGTQDKKAAQQQASLIDRAVAAKIADIAPAAGGRDAPSAVKITMTPSPKIESADGQYSFQPFGRLQFDVTHFVDDKTNQPDNANFRRARLGFKGNVGNDLNYKAEVDFGAGAAVLKETYLDYTGFSGTDIMAGNFKPPSGLEQNTSTNYMSFIELSPVSNAFTRAEILGGAVKTGGNNWSLAAGMFNDIPVAPQTTGDEAWSLDARGSVNLLSGSPNALHVGVSGSYRTPNSASGFASLTGKPAGTGSNLISTGALANVNDSAVYGTELAGVFGPFSVQGEYMWDEIRRDGGSANVSLNGWYAETSYFLTGESRPYNGKTGNFDRVKPTAPFSLKSDGMGAWEVLARYDVLDLNDIGAGVHGGRMDDWTLGVNWYLNNNVRLMLDYVNVNTDSHAVTPNDNPQVITLRTQVDF